MSENALLQSILRSNAIERLFDCSGIGFVVVSINQKILYANDAYCSMLGYTLDELRELPVLVYTHPADKVRTATMFQHAAESNLQQVFEKRYVSRSGETVWCKLRSESVADEHGNTMYRIVMVENVTRDKLNEINLEQMAAITESSDDAIFRSDTNGIIEFWGKGAERMYGYTAAEAVGRNADFIVAEQHRDVPLRANLRLQRGEVLVDPDSLARRKDGSLVEISVLVFPIKGKDGRIVAYAAVHRDISAFKQLQLQLRHSQRLETAGLLAGGIAHDFNNIITVIQGASALLAQGFPEGSVGEQHLQLIERSADRATRLTRQLLAFSRKQKITPQTIDPNALIGDSISLLNRTLGDDIRLDTDLQSSWCVREDSTQLEQVLLNLAVNARYAMPRGGTLGISTRDVTLQQGISPPSDWALHLCPTAITPGDYVRIAVRDSGCGMPQETLEHIFDPFFTTKPKGEGTGLGLSVVYGMVTQVGGGISVGTTPGSGSEFIIFLPRVSADAAAAAPQAPDRELHHSGRVLVVEDDEGVRMLTAALLQKAGYTVFKAANPREVLEGHVSGDVDLILSDVVMPEISGPEFAERWLQQHPNARFLFMSGFFEDGSFAAGMRGRPLIQKPFKPRYLLAAVAAVINDEPLPPA